MDSPTLNSMAYEPPVSLWKLVEESVSAEEKAEVKKILGSSLVDQTIELHSEVEAFLEIWQDLKTENDNLIHSPRQFLPEPPGMRDSLRNHIKMLVESIRERAAENGRNSDVVLSNHNQDIINYAMDEGSRGSSPGFSNQQSRPQSAFSIRSGRETPMRTTPSTDSDRFSGTTTMSEQVDSFRDQLNIFKIDEVVQQLRSTLEDEASQLLSDISFLQGCLEDESVYRSTSSMSSFSEPSIQELRTERLKLEKSVSSSSLPDSMNIINSVQVMNRSLPSSPTRRLPTTLSPISASSQKIRPSPPTSADQGRYRSVPLRGDHTVQTLNKTDSKNNNILNQSSLRQTGNRDNKNAITFQRVTGVRRLSEPSRPPSSLPMQPSPPPMQPTSPHMQPSPPPMQPSPPSSAKPTSSRLTSSRFRHRLRDLKDSKT